MTPCEPLMTNLSGLPDLTGFSFCVPPVVEFLYLPPPATCYLLSANRHPLPAIRYPPLASFSFAACPLPPDEVT